MGNWQVTNFIPVHPQHFLGDYPLGGGGGGQREIYAQ